MKAISMASAFIATIVQVALILGLWTVAYYIAVSQGRAVRSDLSFSITMTYGVFLIGFLCLVSSIVAASTPKNRFRLIAIGISTAIWSFWMIPSFDYYPYQGPAYFGIGCVVLVVGSIFLTSSIMRGLQSRASNKKRAENKL